MINYLININERGGVCSEGFSPHLNHEYWSYDTRKIIQLIMTQTNNKHVIIKAYVRIKIRVVVIKISACYNIYER